MRHLQTLLHSFLDIRLLKDRMLQKLRNLTSDRCFTVPFPPCQERDKGYWRGKVWEFIRPSLFVREFWSHWCDICCRFVKGNQLGIFNTGQFLVYLCNYHLVLRYFCSWKDSSISYFSKLDSPRFSTTKRAFDDFLRTIRELKKLRCCWDLWMGENWKKKQPGASVDVLCMWLLVGFLWKRLYVLSISMYIHTIFTIFTICFLWSLDNPETRASQ